jgi:hypothetical protein
MKYRADLRGFDLAEVEDIVRHSDERYIDHATGREIVIGRHQGSLVVVPIETDGGDIIPVTIHQTTRQQVNLRLKTGRYLHA